METLTKSVWECPECMKENIEKVAKGVTTVEVNVKELAEKIVEMLATKAEFAGVVKIDNLPTSDPSNPGQLYNDAGTVKVSQ